MSVEHQWHYYDWRQTTPRTVATAVISASGWTVRISALLDSGEQEIETKETRAIEALVIEAIDKLKSIELEKNAIVSIHAIASKLS